jgi:hypothetical protein
LPGQSQVVSAWDLRDRSQGVSCLTSWVQLVGAVREPSLRRTAPAMCATPAGSDPIGAVGITSTCSMSLEDELPPPVVGDVRLASRRFGVVVGSAHPTRQRDPGDGYAMACACGTIANRPYNVRHDRPACKKASLKGRGLQHPPDQILRLRRRSQPAALLPAAPPPARFSRV